eukprot:COSAG01_NODE_2119_length_8380_cov_44.533510_3_plen_122_part_00
MYGAPAGGGPRGPASWAAGSLLRPAGGLEQASRKGGRAAAFQSLLGCGPIPRQRRTRTRPLARGLAAFPFLGQQAAAFAWGGSSFCWPAAGAPRPRHRRGPPRDHRIAPLCSLLRCCMRYM